METSVTPSPFPGDPGHEGSSKPMHGLKGTCSGVHTQAVDGPFTNSGSAVGSPSDTSGDIAGWDSTTIASTGGSHGISSSGLRKS